MRPRKVSPPGSGTGSGMFGRGGRAPAVANADFMFRNQKQMLLYASNLGSGWSQFCFSLYSSVCLKYFII